MIYRALQNLRNMRNVERYESFCNCGQSHHRFIGMCLIEKLESNSKPVKGVAESIRTTVISTEV